MLAVRIVGAWNRSYRCYTKDFLLFVEIFY